MRFFVIRHKRTGELMPQMLRGRGYTHWNPNTDSKVHSQVNLPRLFYKRDSAVRSIGQWAQGKMERCFTTGDYGQEEVGVTVRHDGRGKEDLEIVEVELRFK